MLVLSRKVGQTIELPELEIVVRVIAVKGGRVQLGIDAPAQFAVHRGEKGRPSAAGEVANSSYHSAAGSEPWRDNDSKPLSRREANRVLDELVRLEAELSAVAELADPANRSIAQRVAADAMQRIEGINRSVRMTLRQRRSEAQPIAELMQVRADVLDRLREQTAPQPIECCD